MNRTNRHQQLIAHLTPWMISTISEQMATINLLDKIWDEFPSAMLPEMVHRHINGTQPRGALPVELGSADLAPVLASAREYLTSEATMEEVQMALGVLGKGMKWPPGTIGNPSEHLAIMTYQVVGRYSPAVLFAAVFLLIDEQPWAPGVKDVHEACHRVSRRIGAMLQFLELPPHEQQTAAYLIEMGVTEPNRIAAGFYKNLRRKDRAIAAAYRRANRDK